MGIARAAVWSSGVWKSSWKDLAGSLDAARPWDLHLCDTCLVTFTGCAPGRTGVGIGTAPALPCSPPALLLV